MSTFLSGGYASARNDLVATEQLPEERIVEIEEEAERLSNQGS